MPTVTEDFYGHRSISGTGGASLTGGAVSTTAVGTIAPTTAAGAAPTVTVPSSAAFVCNDTGGTFDLSPVTGGGAQAAGAVVRIFFAKPYPKAPKAVFVNVVQVTDVPNVAVSAAAFNISETGFDITPAAALTTAKVYRVSYSVQP